MSGHTKGPWLVELPSLDVISDEEDVSICSVQPVDAGGPKMFHHGEETRTNARLIAAAPDLLEALEGVLRVADRQTDEFDAARAAIAKARGEV